MARLPKSAKTSGKKLRVDVLFSSVARIQLSEKRFDRRRALGIAMLLALLIAALLSGCLSPTLPLPPPSRPDVSAPDEDGYIRISGAVQSRASVFALNQRTDEIVGEVTGADGAYDLMMKAEVGDRISVWQSIHTKESGSTDIIVPDVTIVNGTPPDPDAMGGGPSE